METKQLLTEMIQDFNIQNYIKNINDNEVIINIDDFNLIQRKIELILKYFDRLNKINNEYFVDVDLINEYLSNIEHLNYKNEFRYLLDKHFHNFYLYGFIGKDISYKKIKSLIYDFNLFNEQFFLIDNKFKSDGELIKNIINYLKSILLKENVLNAKEILKLKPQQQIKESKNESEKQNIDEKITNDNLDWDWSSVVNLDNNNNNYHDTPLEKSSENIFNNDNDISEQQNNDNQFNQELYSIGENLINEDKYYNLPENNIQKSSMKKFFQKTDRRLFNILKDLQLEKHKLPKTKDELRSIETRIKILKAILKLKKENIELTCFNIYKNAGGVSTTSIRKYMKLFLK